MAEGKKPDKTNPKTDKIILASCTDEKINSDLFYGPT